MADIIGRKGKIVIEISQHLFYEVSEFLDDNSDHISFKDKHGSEYTFRKKEVIQINVI